MVYFVQRLDGLIKIGYSSFVAVRAQGLASEHGTLKLLAVIDGRLVTERAHHALFAQHRVTGEWFAPHQELLDYVATLSSSEPPRTFRRRAPDPVRVPAEPPDLASLPPWLAATGDAAARGLPIRPPRRCSAAVADTK
jgi:hypothetical protein